MMIFPNSPETMMDSWLFYLLLCDFLADLLLLFYEFSQFNVLSYYN